VVFKYPPNEQIMARTNYDENATANNSTTDEDEFDHPLLPVRLSMKDENDEEEELEVDAKQIPDNNINATSVDNEINRCMTATTTTTTTTTPSLTVETGSASKSALKAWQPNHTVHESYLGLPLQLLGNLLSPKTPLFNQRFQLAIS
jgi:hypothetical protein